MHLLLSIALVVAAAFGGAWLVDGWLGEARRVWVGVVGVGLMVGGGGVRGVTAGDREKPEAFHNRAHLA